MVIEKLSGSDKFLRGKLWVVLQKLCVSIVLFCDIFAEFLKLYQIDFFNNDTKFWREKTIYIFDIPRISIF